jgi:acyl-CoA dehydrogenase
MSAAGTAGIRRGIYDEEHEQFRLMVREFLEREVVPVFPEWERAGVAPREVFARLGDLGVLGMTLDEEHGGSGIEDYRFNAVLQEETARAGVTIGPLRTHLDVVVPYFRHLASPEQRRRWFPGISAGTIITALALTEPDTGSDLAAVRTAARLDGDAYVIDGAKTYITGGSLADLVIVLARTSRDPENRRAGLTLLVVESGTPGFTVGRKLEKIGLRAQDTVELGFDGVRVPVENRLGEEGSAFAYLTSNLPQERLAIAVGSVAQARAALDATLVYARERELFGQSLSRFQNTKFELAAAAADLEAAQAVLDNAVLKLVAGELDPAAAALVKLVCTEMQGRVVDRCLQLFGGFGYMTESPIARLYADARVTRIYGGTSEVMKLIIAKSLGL